MRKLFLTAALCLSLTGAAYAAPGQGEVSEAGSNVEVVEAVSINFDDQTPREADSSQLPPSNLAKKMTQAEKAHNAAVNDSWGGAITIIAMVIVVSALAILSLLFLGFGKISEYFLTKQKRQSAKAAGVANDDTSHEVDSGEVIAAIALALSEHFGEGHDMEDTILTIRRMKRAYSPWNSKIYNMRHTPETLRNTPQRSAF